MDAERNLIWEAYGQINERFRDFTEVVNHVVNDPQTANLGEEEMVTAVIELALRSGVYTGHAGMPADQFRERVHQHIQELKPVNPQR